MALDAGPVAAPAAAGAAMSLVARAAVAVAVAVEADGATAGVAYCVQVDGIGTEVAAAEQALPAVSLPAMLAEGSSAVADLVASKVAYWLTGQTELG